MLGKPICFIQSSNLNVNLRDFQDGRGVRRRDNLPPTNTSEIHLHVEQPLQNTY